MEPIGNPFQATVRHQSSIGIIDLVGDMIDDEAPALESAYTEAVGQQATSILLNFAQVGYINSGGIALLVTLLKCAHETKQKILACHLKPYFAELFEITQLTEFIQIHPDEASALAAVKE